LLVDSREFWNHIRADLSDAEGSAYVQTFSFEGDRVGTALGRALERCPAADRRLLVDGYSLLYHSDRLIPGPAWFDRNFRREVMLTHRWVRRLKAGGTGVRFGNPIGPSPTKIIRRSHKKLAVFDDRVVYLGGINFSDHNFAWHDMMFRVEDPELGTVMAADFRASWDGRPLSGDREVGPLRVISVNGRANPARFAPILDALAEARYSIDVVSAYLSHPFTDHLAAARRRGIRVRILTPGENNKANLARYVLLLAHRHDFEVFKYSGGMSHMKAILIDGDHLITGSSNFDFMSYHIMDELVVMTRDRRVIDPYLERLWEPDLASARFGPERPSVGTWLGHSAVRVGAVAAGLLARR
jgi:cardiolipin synthase A/B